MHTVKWSDSSILNKSIQRKSLAFIQIKFQTVLFDALPGSDGNEGVLHIPQSSRVTGTSPSDC